MTETSTTEGNTKSPRTRYIPIILMILTLSVPATRSGRLTIRNYVRRSVYHANVLLLKGGAQTGMQQSIVMIVGAHSTMSIIQLTISDFAEEPAAMICRQLKENIVVRVIMLRLSHLKWTS